MLGCRMTMSSRRVKQRLEMTVWYIVTEVLQITLLYVAADVLSQFQPVVDLFVHDGL